MLDKYQQEIVEQRCNMLVIAGPGAGKTTTIISKVNYLLMNVKEDKILLISFTNQSVNDIKGRINANVKVMTFHKLAIDILKYNHINYQICSEKLLDYIINEYFQTLDIKDKNEIITYLQIPAFNKKYYYSLTKLIKSFIFLFKTNNHQLDTLKKIVNNEHDKLLIRHIIKIFYLYEEEKNSTSTFDFDDLIIKATNLLKEKYNYYSFKEIIIDEFQDTSLIRLNLIKELYYHNNCHITAVGDDAQSIYAFTGCDLNIFLNFQNYFPDVKILYLRNTYRNSKELVYLTEQFIEKNPLQLKKKMHSNISVKSPIEIIYYLNPKKAILKLLNKLPLDKVLILMRNKSDLKMYLSAKLYIKDNLLYYKDTEISYLTIHSAKGLEKEYVIILNVSDSLLGIPNHLEDHYLLKYLKRDIDKYPFSEERRVFFVALTRCKIKTYLLVPFVNSSPFVRELKHLIL